MLLEYVGVVPMINLSLSSYATPNVGPCMTLVGLFEYDDGAIADAGCLSPPLL